MPECPGHRSTLTCRSESEFHLRETCLSLGSCDLCFCMLTLWANIQFCSSHIHAFYTCGNTLSIIHDTSTIVLSYNNLRDGYYYGRHASNTNFSPRNFIHNNSCWLVTRWHAHLRGPLPRYTTDLLLPQQWTSLSVCRLLVVWVVVSRCRFFPTCCM